MFVPHCCKLSDRKTFKMKLLCMGKKQYGFFATNHVLLENLWKKVIKVGKEKLGPIVVAQLAERTP